MKEPSDTSEEVQNILTSTQTYNVCMQNARANARIHTQTHAQQEKTKHSQRLRNKEKSVMSRTSKHNHHHSSAYTD